MANSSNGNCRVCVGGHRNAADSPCQYIPIRDLIYIILYSTSHIFLKVQTAKDA